MTIEHILSDIETQLADVPARGLSGPWLRDEFGRCYERYEAVTDQMALIADDLSSVFAAKLAEAPTDRPYRVCSLACGDGVMDEMVLKRVLDRPEAAGRDIAFLGIDVNEALCRAEARRLESLPITADVRCLDLDQLTPKDAPDMDFVYMVHGHYYAPDFAAQLERILAIRGPSTGIQIISARQAVYNQLYVRFWQHELGREWWLAEQLQAALNARQIDYTARELMATLDVSRCIEDDFSTPFSRDLLDFLCHIPLAAYPVTLQRRCQDWLRAAAQLHDGRHELEHPCLFLSIAPDS